MTKKEFMNAWAEIRESALRRMYEGDPHGPACLAMSLTEIPQEGEKLWRKYRPAFKAATVTEFREKYAVNVDGAL